MKNQDDTDRLKQLENLLDEKDRRSTKLCWIRWDPNSKYGYDINDAREEIRWMVYEIKQLREENAELKSFVDNFREAMEVEFKKK